MTNDVRLRSLTFPIRRLTVSQIATLLSRLVVGSSAERIAGQCEERTKKKAINIRAVKMLMTQWGEGELLPRCSSLRARK